MPKEDRRILFDDDEIYRAIYALCAQKQIKKPKPGKITSIIEDEDDNARILITLENPGEGEKYDIEYSRDFIAAALMLFCRGLAIPLPKTARKTVLIREGRVMLRIQI